MASSKSSPLLSSRGTRLYDPVCTLDIPPDVAHGYIVLLSGGQPAFASSPNSSSNNSPVIDDDVIALAFSSICDGNVIDVCFGSPFLPQGAADPSSPARYARDAKMALSDAADTDPTVQRLAVETYAEVFRIVHEYGRETSKLNPCTRCCLYEKLHRGAEVDLAVAFQMLSESIESRTVA